MLTSLQLSNFKGFQDNRIEFSNFSAVIGKNNAGKSSAFEAIRILANVCNHFPKGRFTTRPSWVGGVGTGIDCPTHFIDRNLETLFFRYANPPARITSTFSTGLRIDIFIGSEGIIYAEGFDQDGTLIRTRGEAKRNYFPSIKTLPQIRPLEDAETVLREDYVRRCADTHMSSRHFRNQIRYEYQHFEYFCDLFHQTWPNVRIAEFSNPTAEHEEDLAIMLMDEGFVAEASNFGHGLQMWLQITWFLSRVSSDSIVVLDEPDVYIHPEQQSQLVKILRGRFSQCLLSTHSHHIMNSCDTSEILRLHRKLPVSGHGLSQEQYDHDVQNAVSSVLIETHQENEELVVIEITLQEKSSVSVLDVDGEVIDSFRARGKEECWELTLPRQRIIININSPMDVAISIAGTPLGLSQFRSQNWAELVIDL